MGANEKTSPVGNWNHISFLASTGAEIWDWVLFLDGLALASEKKTW